MSKSVSLDLKLVSKEKSSVKAILKILIESGWRSEMNGFVNYLPLNDNELFNWKREQISIDQLFNIIDLKEQNQEIVGVDLYWLNSDTGVSLLIFNSEEVSFSLDINRKYIDEAKQLIDFNCYSTTILLKLYNLLNIVQYKYEVIS